MTGLEARASDGRTSAVSASPYARNAARLAHLLGIGNVLFSLVGLIGASVIFRTNRNEPFVRANARGAINMQLTWLLFAAVVFAVYFAIFLGHGAIVRVEDVESGRLLTQKRWLTAISLLGLIVLSMVVTIVLNIVGAIAASRGAVYAYPIAIPFLRVKKV